MFTVCYEGLKDYNPNKTCVQNSKELVKKVYCKSIEEARRIATQKMLEGYLTAIFSPAGIKVG